MVEQVRKALLQSPAQEEVEGCGMKRRAQEQDEGTTIPSRD
jgi:hypothetical protein